MYQHPLGLVWLRTDLRLHDHEPIYCALQHCAHVVLVYCFDARHYRLTSYGWPKTGARRVSLLLGALEDLRRQVASLNGVLILRQGAAARHLPELAQQLGATAVYTHRETTPEETAEEEEVERALWAHSIPLKMSWGHTLYHPDDLPFPVKSLPDVFTTFRKEVERGAKIRPLFETPTDLRAPASALSGSSALGEARHGELPTLRSLSPEFDRPTPEARELPKSYTIEGGEQAALAHLEQYTFGNHLLSTYKETRNGLSGMGYSSKLSAWLALGCLSPRRIQQTIRDYEQQIEANESTYWLTFELLWRDYFRFVARRYGAALFRPEGIRPATGKTPPPPTTLDPSLFRRWTEGRTGFPFIDANMRHLAATGFMSNRGRQNVASFLVRDLRQDWRAGAAWFEHTLVDYDPCSNWGNWTYIAGVGNDPRPNRHFNVVKQGRDYDPDGTFIREWVPELAVIDTDMIHEPYRISAPMLEGYGIKLNRDYPRPIVKLGRNMG